MLALDQVFFLESKHIFLKSCLYKYKIAIISLIIENEKGSHWTMTVSGETHN